MRGPEGGTAQQNPFPLVTVNFRVQGLQGDSTPLTFSNVVMSDQEGAALPDAGARDTLITVGGAYPPAPPGTPAVSTASLLLLIAIVGRLGQAHARHRFRPTSRRNSQ